jgi:hypothetical protein
MDRQLGHGALGGSSEAQAFCSWAGSWAPFSRSMAKPRTMLLAPPPRRTRGAWPAAARSRAPRRCGGAEPRRLELHAQCERAALPRRWAAPAAIAIAAAASRSSSDQRAARINAPSCVSWLRAPSGPIAPAPAAGGLPRAPAGPAAPARSRRPAGATARAPGCLRQARTQRGQRLFLRQRGLRRLARARVAARDELHHRVEQRRVHACAPSAASATGAPAWAARTARPARAGRHAATRRPTSRISSTRLSDRSTRYGGQNTVTVPWLLPANSATAAATANSARSQIAARIQRPPPDRPRASRACPAGGGELHGAQQVKGREVIGSSVLRRRWPGRSGCRRCARARWFALASAVAAAAWRQPGCGATRGRNSG